MSSNENVLYLKTKRISWKIDSKGDEGTFLGYSSSSKSCRLFNKRSLTREELFHFTFDESNLKFVEVEVVDCASILEKISIEDKEEYKDQEINQEKDQIKNEGI